MKLNVQLHASAALPAEKSWVGHAAGLDVVAKTKFHDTLGNRTLDVQLIASHITDWVIYVCNKRYIKIWVLSGMYCYIMIRSQIYSKYLYSNQNEKHDIASYQPASSKNGCSWSQRSFSRNRRTVSVNEFAYQFVLPNFFSNFSRAVITSECKYVHRSSKK